VKAVRQDRKTEEDSVLHQSGWYDIVKTGMNGEKKE